MKNYVIAFLFICIVVLGTYVYKLTNVPVLNNFPIDHPIVYKPGDEPPLYLYFFFSQHSCPVCLEAVQVLNELPAPFFVAGVVPVAELDKEDNLRKATGAAFRLIPFKKSLRKFNPHYTPSIFGVSGHGRILFILPGVPGGKDYLYNFLVSFYGRNIEMLISELQNESG